MNPGYSSSIFLQLNYGVLTLRAVFINNAENCFTRLDLYYYKMHYVNIHVGWVTIN